MKDPEVVDLRNKFLISTLVIILFLIPTIFIFINKFGAGSPKIVKQINKKENLTVFITGPECDQCEEIETVLSTNKVKYYKLSISKSKEYDEFLKKLSISNNEVVIPTLMYITDGDLVATLVDIKDEEELNGFIETYQLSK